MVLGKGGLASFTFTEKKKGKRGGGFTTAFFHQKNGQWGFMLILVRKITLFLGREKGGRSIYLLSIGREKRKSASPMEGVSIVNRNREKGGKEGEGLTVFGRGEAHFHTLYVGSLF